MKRVLVFALAACGGPAAHASDAPPPRSRSIRPSRGPAHLTVADGNVLVANQGSAPRFVGIAARP